MFCLIIHSLNITRFLAFWVLLFKEKIVTDFFNMAVNVSELDGLNYNKEY